MASKPRAEQPARPRAGRPIVLPGQRRRQVLLDAAARIFLTKGYEATTMSAVAVAAGMSKKTLYQVFTSKLALFDALLEDRLCHPSGMPDTAGCSQEEGLVRLLMAIADVLLRPDRMGLIRLIITDGQASPELVTAFERLRMGNKLNALGNWVQQEMEAGRLPEGDVLEIAHMLFGMTIAEPMVSTLCRAPPMSAGACPEVSMEKRIRAAVGIFLRGVAGCSVLF